ncbi:MAG: ABC transporter substrate-binding protein, partial [Myxococcales bacterium]
MIRLRDARQRDVLLPAPPRRIISLVPSDTLSVVALGAADRLIGRTDYCVEPADQLAHVPTLGGTKDPRLDEVIALAPDLILVNQEENS